MSGKTNKRMRKMASIQHRADGFYKKKYKEQTSEGKALVNRIIDSMIPKR